MKTCLNCGNDFPTRMVIDGIKRQLQQRKFCLDCSPWGANNRKDLTRISSRIFDPNGHYKCSICKLTKSMNNFYLRKGNKVSSHCKACHCNRTRERLRQNKRDFVAYKGGCCERCGYSRPVGLAFHHFDPSVKEFGFNASPKITDRIKAELDKCYLLCSRCHLEVHADFVDGVLEAQQWFEAPASYVRS